MNIQKITNNKQSSFGQNIFVVFEKGMTEEEMRILTSDLVKHNAEKLGIKKPGRAFFLNGEDRWLVVDEATESGNYLSWIGDLLELNFDKKLLSESALAKLCLGELANVIRNVEETKSFVYSKFVSTLQRSKSNNVLPEFQQPNSLFQGNQNQMLRVSSEPIENQDDLRISKLRNAINSLIFADKL